METQNETNNPELIVSLATIPSRFEYLKLVVPTILNQTIYSKVKHFYITLADNLTPDVYAMYDEIAKLDDKIIIQKADYRWRSANKLLSVYDKHRNDIIVTFDDDIKYPADLLEHLYAKWTMFPKCIITTETNPVVLKADPDNTDDIKVMYLNSVSVKLEQLENSKYLTNACLFCPNALSDLVFNYDKFLELCDGTHDELWFWVVSTLNGTQSVCLNYTFSLELDEDVKLPLDECALGIHNNKPEVIDDLNNRINTLFGEDLKTAIAKMPIVFFVTQSNILSIVGNVSLIHAHYSLNEVMFVLSPKLTVSWEKLLVHNLHRFEWKSVKIGKHQPESTNCENCK